MYKFSHSGDQWKFQFDKTLNLNILKQELCIIMVIVKFSNNFVTSSHSSNSLKHFQCNDIFFYAKGPKFWNFFVTPRAKGEGSLDFRCKGGG